MGKKSKNNPSARNKMEVTVRKCEFCGCEKGVHPAKIGGSGRKQRMAWVCNEDKCIRFK